MQLSNNFYLAINKVSKKDIPLFLSFLHDIPLLPSAVKEIPSQQSNWYQLTSLDIGLQSSNSTVLYCIVLYWHCIVLALYWLIY